MGREQKGTRPVVIVSGNSMNMHYDVVITCPITSSIKNTPGSVFLVKSKLNNLKEDSEILVLQIRTLSKLKFKKKIGVIDNIQFNEILSGLNKLFKY